MRLHAFSFHTVNSLIDLPNQLIFRYQLKKVLEWKAKGVSGPFPIPIFGNTYNYLWLHNHLYDYFCFRKYGSMFFDFNGPGGSNLNLADPALVKEVLVQRFPSFSDKIHVAYNVPYVRQSLIFIHGPQWKRVRSLTTPIFTSARLRTMWNQMKMPIRQAHDSLNRAISANGHSDRRGRVEIKQQTMFFAVDVIGSLVFSMKIDSSNRPNDPFFTNVFDLANFRDSSGFLLFMLPEKLYRLLKVSFVRPEAANYFVNFSLKLIQERRRNPDVQYNDFLHHLLNFVNDPSETNCNSIEKGMTLEEAVGQCLFFFMAGVETSATAIVFTLYLLAKHPEAQEKLYQALCEAHPTDDIPYDQLNACKLLESALIESLRMYPPVTKLFRTTVEPVQLSNGIRLSKGQTVTIPLYAMHHDPKLFSNPFQFQIDRFIDCDPELAKSCVLAFSSGPMNCLGQRFAYLQIKNYLISVLKQFRFSLCPNGESEPKLRRMRFVSQVDELPLIVQKRC